MQGLSWWADIIVHGRAGAAASFSGGRRTGEVGRSGGGWMEDWIIAWKQNAMTGIRSKGWTMDVVYLCIYCQKVKCEEEPGHGARHVSICPVSTTWFLELGAKFSLGVKSLLLTA